MKLFQIIFMRLFAARVPLALALFLVSKGSEAASLTVKSVELSNDQVATAIIVTLNGNSTPVLDNLGDKVVIKIKDAKRASGLKAPAGSGLVKTVRFGDHGSDLWIVADLTRPSSAAFKATSSGFEVTLKSKGASAAAKVATSPTPVATESSDGQLQSLAPSGSNQTARIVDVSLGESGGNSQVVVSSDAPVSYRPAVSEGGKKITLTFRNAGLSWAAVDIAGDDPALRSLKARQISVRGESQVLVELSLKDKLPYSIVRDQNQVMVNLSRMESAERPKGKGNLDMEISVDFESADIVGVLRNIADQAGFESKLGNAIMALTEKDRLITYNAVKRPLKEVLYGVLHQNNQAFEFGAQDHILFFGSQADLAILRAGGKTTTKFYTPRNQTKSILMSLVSGTAKDYGEMLAPMGSDPSDAQKIMISGLESDVATTMKYLRRWDLPETGEAAAADSQPADEMADGKAKKTKIYSLKYLDASNSTLLSAGIKQVIPPDVILAGDFVFDFDGKTRKLLVTSKLKYIKAIDRLLERLDTRTPQVRIEGKLVEVSSNEAKNLGIVWGYNQQNGTQSTALGFAAAQGGPATATFRDAQALSQINVTVDALVARDLANIISSPSLTVKDGTLASIVGTEEIVVQKATVVDTLAGPKTTFEFVTQEIPIILEVTPKISFDEGKVDMLITFTLSSVIGEAIGGAPAPITKQTIRTTVMVSNGETAVIGGLTKESWSKNTRGIPVLGDIPLLGLLFRGERVRKIKKDVIIFITPTIVED